MHNIASMSSPLARKEAAAIAAKAQVDPRTLAAYLAGRRVQDASRSAIERALRAARRADLVRQPQRDAA